MGKLCLKDPQFLQARDGRKKVLSAEGIFSQLSCHCASATLYSLCFVGGPVDIRCDISLNKMTESRNTMDFEYGLHQNHKMLPNGPAKLLYVGNGITHVAKIAFVAKQKKTPTVAKTSWNDYVAKRVSPMDTFQENVCVMPILLIDRGRHSEGVPARSWSN